MGGYGSGRPSTRPAAEASYRLDVASLAPKLRAMRAEGHTSGGPLVLSWSRGGELVASIWATLVDDAAGPRCVLSYAAAGVKITDALDLAELPSNLGRGRLLYWRCPCGQLARVLYLGDGARWRCRRCVRPVYASSRESDRRVSAILAGNLPDRPPPGPPPGPGASARSLTRYLGSLDTGGLIVLLNAYKRQERYHGAQGRPWSSARRAAHERSRRG